MKKSILILLSLCSYTALLAQFGISSQPVDAGSCPNEGVNFSVTTVGANTFQWQVLPLTSEDWLDLDDQVYPTSGATTENLTYTVSGDMDGFKFRCQVSDGGTPITSSEATFSISQPAVILEHPVVSTNCLGTTETQFSVTVESGSFTYQWQRFEREGEYYEDLSNDSEYYSNVTTSTLTVSNPDFEMDSSYPILRCVITNGSCELASTTAPLYLYTGITINTQPTGYTCLETGDNVMLSIETSQDWLPGLPYQWQVSDGDGFVDISDDEYYSGSTSIDLSILSINATHQGTYRCVVGACVDGPISDEVNVQFAPDLPQPELLDITGQCSLEIPTAPKITSECFGGELTGVADLTGPVTEQGTHVLTWTFTDTNNDEHEFTQNLIIDDTTAPEVDQSELDDITSVCEVEKPSAPTATDNCSGAITATTDTTFPVTTIGTTTIRWTYDDGNGNETIQEQNLVISACEDEVTLAIHNNADYLNIYPNPTSGIINIELSQTKDTKFDILTLDGKILGHYQTTNGRSQINSTDILPGIYLLHIVEKGNQYLKKIILQ